MYQIRAMWHAWSTGHQPWTDQMIWPNDEGVPNWRESTVRRERPE